MIEHFLPAMITTFDPSKGKGWTESILAIMIVGATLWCVVGGQEIPQVVILAMGTIMGWYFGTKTTDYAKGVQDGKE